MDQVVAAGAVVVVEPQEAQVQESPQEQPALRFSLPVGCDSRPHLHGLHPQWSPHEHVVWSPPPLLAEDAHLQPVPPGHGTAHPHLSSHPMVVDPAGSNVRKIYYPVQ